MTFSLPNLDDRSYSDLVEEALELLPRYAPEWTNHNPSDPGITLIELLAYFTEAIVYRTNRLTDLDRQGFLRLLEGDVPGQDMGAEGLDAESIRERTLKIVWELNQAQRAVTQADFETLAIRASTEHKTRTRVARAHCVPRSNLADAADRITRRPGFVSVVIIPDRNIPSSEMQQLLAVVQRYLEPRCLLTTRLQVVPPLYVCISFRADIGLQEGANPADVTAMIDTGLKYHFHHLPDKEHGTKGWPFGRNVYISELIDLLEGIDGVDFVRHPSVLGIQTRDKSEPVTIKTMGFQIGVRSTIGEDTIFSVTEAIEWHRLELDSLGQPTSVLLNPYELPRVDLQIGEFIRNWHGYSQT